LLAVDAPARMERRPDEKVMKITAVESCAETVIGDY
jgi:hypothetical protein